MHTVLVVDDNRLVQRLLGFELQDRGFRVLQAGTIEQALTVATTEPDISLAVLDYRIEPDKTGAELAQRLLALPGWNTIPLIGHSIDDQAKRAFAQAGVAYFCPKSGNVMDVVELIETILSNPAPSR